MQRDPFLASSSIKKSNNSLFGDKYPRLAVTKKGFVRLIQVINSNTVRKDLRDQFLQYQLLVFDFMFGSFEQNQKVQQLYRRRKKLKRYKNKYEREIRAIDKQLEEHWDNKYLQGRFQFKQVEE